ncbi:GNAT family N-acetyltransferase [Paenarthrobacter sp. 4246]|uniref:GNAT family N-acetyltransferase n=1 Tax=Paenarthrobacter sp. 4246 TaxID=3156456 RepID=UPI003397FBDA
MDRLEPVTIRAGKPDDSAACAQLWGAAIAHRDVGRSAEEIEGRAIGKLGREWAALVVASANDGHIIGFSLLVPEDNDQSVRSAHLSMLAVAPDIQGSGLGTRLLAATQDEARAKGIGQLTLRVLTANTGARRLYEAAGWFLSGQGRFEDTGRAFTGYALTLAGP